MKHEKCRSCGVVVVWAYLKSGKRAPFNATPVPIALGKPPHGAYVLRAVGADVYADEYATEKHAEAVAVRLNHFATCPEADAWRKP